ncbi:MAG: right-handed parallel beta-helix repeat-containing protein [Planctomycetes bacterium]|nr:right-handed parallel beta-helix repeat-containing protein [Planctomycetota bacterium]
MLRRMIIGVTVMSILVCLAGQARGADYWVHPDGNDSNPGTGQEPFRTIQHAINQCTSDNNDIINVQDDPCEPNDYVTPPIYVNCNKVHFIFEEAVVVEAEPNAFPNSTDCLFKATSKSNIVFDGTGATLRMRKSEYPAEDEHRHVIGLWSCTNVEVKGLTLKDSGGDGICIGDANDGGLRYCEHILIKDVTCDNNYRNGITVGSANDLTIEDCVLKNTNGTLPMAGIDFEPFTPWHQLAQIRLRNTRIENNEKKGIMFGLGAFSAWHCEEYDPNDIVPLDVVLENIYVTGPGGIIVYGPYQYGPLGSIEFRNVTVEDANYGLTICKSSLRAGLSFVNCVWKNVGSTDHYGNEVCPISVFNEHYWYHPVGVDFIDCQVFDDVNRPAINHTDHNCAGGYFPEAEALYDIHGHLYVKNPNRVPADPQDPNDPNCLFDWAGADLYDVDIKVLPAYCKAFSVQDSSAQTVALFDSVGDLILKGTLTESTTPTATANDEFRVQDSNSVDVAIIDANEGNMYIHGALYENLRAQTPPQPLEPPEGSDDFIIRNSSGAVIAYIDASGNLYLKGELYENYEP